MNDPDLDRTMLERAARLALRSHGEAEPNPTVGCIIADREGNRVGDGRTNPPGGPHAEVAALTVAGEHARGGTMWVTLEPCNHHGRTPPCVDAVIAAGIARVVVGRRDRHAIASGGLERLRAAGVEVEVREDVPLVRRLHQPFERSVLHNLPWVTAKWAQTSGGTLVAPDDRDRRISGPASHRLVHRQRGRCDAVLTGIGTVLKDDPRLDARCRHPRRIPLRVVVDPAFDLPTTARIVSQDQATVIVASHVEALADRAAERAHLETLGVRFLPLECTPVDTGWPQGLPEELLPDLLRRLRGEFDVSHILTEAGPGLLETLFGSDLVDAALVFTAPFDFEPASNTLRPGRHLRAGGFTEVWRGRRGEDDVAWWHRTT